MQHRMKEHPLTHEERTVFPDKAPVGGLATLGPYGAPIHFAQLDGKLCIHGLPPVTRWRTWAGTAGRA